jgi:hypothetical protein
VLMFNINRVVFCKKNFNTRNSLVSGVKLKEKSFACKHLQMVKIKCSKDDVRIHKLAHLFRANGIPVDKIFVRRTGSARKSYLLLVYLLQCQCLFGSRNKVI